VAINTLKRSIDEQAGRQQQLRNYIIYYKSSIENDDVNIKINQQQLIDSLQF
jgi:hypothetical protein